MDTTADPTGETAATGGDLLLSDVVALPALAGARVVPPRAKLDRRVRAVALADPDAPAEEDALLLTAGAPPDPLPDGCVAVVCRTAPSAAVGVPVLVLPAGA
ncbi:MAG: hypothetical protein AB1416_05840, partial [Actinomycetota bacterium]